MLMSQKHPIRSPLLTLSWVLKDPNWWDQLGFRDFLVSEFLSFLMFWGGIEPPANWIRQSGIRDFLIALLPYCLLLLLLIDSGDSWQLVSSHSYRAWYFSILRSMKESSQSLVIGHWCCLVVSFASPLGVCYVSRLMGLKLIKWASKNIYVCCCFSCAFASSHNG